MTTVDNSTLPVNVLRTGTSWTVDVTPCNLNISTALKDFRVTINGILIPTTSFTKLSATSIRYDGSPVPIDSAVNVVRQTPINRVSPLIGYGSRLSTVSYEGELNTVHRILHENERRIATLESGTTASSSPLVNEPYNTSWSLDTLFGATRKVLYDKIETVVPKDGGRVTDIAYATAAAQPPDSDNSTALASTAWSRTRMVNYVNSWSTGTPTVVTSPFGYNTRVANLQYLYDNVMPPGVILPFAGSAPLSGWIFCDGRAISRTTYSRLFAAIGTTYGAGDGSTTFRIPNLSTVNRVLACAGGSIGAGDVAGAAYASVPVPLHSHSMSFESGFATANHTHNPVAGYEGFFATRVGGTGGAFTVVTSGGGAHGISMGTYSESNSHKHTVSGTTFPAGVDGATMDVRQSTMYVPFYISTGGQ